MARIIDAPTVTVIDNKVSFSASALSLRNSVGAAKVPLEIAGRESWARLFLEVETRSQLDEWEETIPKFSCSCSSFYKDWKKQNPPSDVITIDYKWNLKEAVNKHLGRRGVTLEQASHIWRQNKPVYRPREVKIVSSVSPKKVDRQRVCIESWLASGFQVVLMQGKQEIDKARSLFDLPVEWVACDFERPKIIDMLRVGVVLNSDCEMRGEGPEFGDSPVGLLRWNYSDGGPSVEEQWGIDCWYLPESYLHLIPDDFPYLLGKPFWDYAVPAFLQYNQVDFSINHKPWLLHERHKLNWSQDDWMEGYSYISSRLPGEYGGIEFRESIDSCKYNYRLGFYDVKST